MTDIFLAKIGRPRQLIKVCYGLRGDENDVTHLRLIGDDSTLMEMDAPIHIPAGSMLAYTKPDGKLLFVHDNTVLREGTL